MIELGGKTLLPGVIDGHSRFTAPSRPQSGPDITVLETIKEGRTVYPAG
jgi:predicted amidohydrolase YtcJ